MESSLSATAVSAKTAYSNTPETDKESVVLHLVTMSDDTVRSVMATDPGDAIKKVNNSCANEYGPITKERIAIWLMSNYQSPDKFLELLFNVLNGKYHVGNLCKDVREFKV